VVVAFEVFEDKAGTFRCCGTATATFYPTAAKATPPEAVPVMVSRASNGTLPVPPPNRRTEARRLRIFSLAVRALKY